jgi:signal transduction histidine kinase
MTAVRLSVWAASAALCAGMALAVENVGQPATIQHREIINAATAFVAITLGIAVWQLRPGSRIGILLVAFPLVGVLSDAHWIFWNWSLAVTVGLAVTMLAAAVFAHLILSYPSGRLATRLDRGFVVFAYTFTLVYALPRLLFFDPRTPNYRDVWECGDCAVPLTHIGWYDTERIMQVFDWLLLPLTLAFVALLVRKVGRATPGGRRIVLPLSIAAFVLAMEFVVQIALNGGPVNSSTHSTWYWIVTLLSLAIPVSLSLGMLWDRRARSAVADLVVELGRTRPGHVRDALAHTLGDPTLDVALWLPERRTYVDGEGRPLELPEPTDDRAVTVLGPPDAPVAALLHDPMLLQRRSLVEAAGAAARLALENERLQAELRAQLAELRASRARIVQAGDEERRRLERNLHDGAQQRLLGLGLALQLARAQLGPDANGAGEVLVEAEQELRAALDELRELARGIHPAVLTDQGLAAALRSLAERSLTPVTIVEVPNERLGEPIEAAAYFLVSESLANCVKYARASAIRISIVRQDGTAVVDVDDDGVGGADPGQGSGLRGLSDRVQALDGDFRVESPPGGGTHIHAEIPCAS